jgi:Kef-type K+ transport system membrane component KefB
MARLTGLKWRESFAIGSLMNARGLIEIIILNIGLDLGILTPRLFTMFVIMAVVTTLAAGPAFLFFTEEKPQR